MSVRAHVALALLMLSACANRERRKDSDAPDRAATPVFGAADLGLCSASPVPAALAEAEHALARGCAAEALAIATPSLASESSAERAQALLVIAEARRLAINEGLGLHGGPGIAFLYSAFDANVWLGTRPPLPEPPVLGGSPERSGLRMVAALDADVDAIARAIEAKDLPRSVIESGRLGNLAVTAVPARGCLDSRVPDDVGPTYVAELARAREAVMGRVGLLQAKTGGELVALSRSAVADCDLKGAVLGFRLAAEKLHTEGARVAAVHSALTSVEAASFLGGRVDTFVSGEATPAALTELAGHQEAGWAGFGWFHDSATQVRTMIEQTSAQFPEEARDPGVRARAQIMLAVAAIRLQGKADAARDHAEQAIRDAVLARRADLADLARVALVLAYVQQELPDPAIAVLDALDRSFDARGTPGARVHVSRVLRNLAAIEAERGRSDTGILLLQLGRRLYPRLSSVQERAMIVRTLPMVLRDSGRVEDAIETFEWARERWAQEKPQVDPKFWAAMDRQFADERAGLLAQLGTDVTTQSDADFLREIGLAAVMDATERNDAAGVHAALRAVGAEQRTALLGAAPSLGLCHALGPELGDVISSLETNTRTISEALAATVGDADIVGRTELRMAMLETSTIVLPQLAFGCGPWLGTSRVDRIVRLVELTRSMSGLGPLAGADRSMYGAIAAHASGRHEEAQKSYLRAASETRERAGLSGATALGLGDLVAPLHTRAAQLALRLGRIEEAIAILEQSRSLDLRASRERARASDESPLGELIAIESAITKTQTRARSIAQMMVSAADPKTRVGLEAAAVEQSHQIEQLQAARDRAVRGTKEKHATAYRAAALAPPLRLADLQRALGPDETIVYYVTLAEEAWAIVVDRAQAKAVELPAIDPKSKMPRMTNALDRIDRELRIRAGRGLKFKADPSRETAAALTVEQARADLHRVLVAPIERLVPAGQRVIVIPDPRLSEVPFASLGSAASPWILRNPLRVLPGAYLLAGTTAASSSGDAVVVGDPEFVVGASKSAEARTAAGEVAWQRLPFTRAEAQKVAALYRSRPLLGNRATEAAVRELAPDARILHIASHGLANTQRPDYSAIVLATPEGGSTADDGILHAYEVERMRLGAEIVVLSACETGLGQVRGAEGMMALDRAFLVAGAGAVVSSLWTVDDASTELLLRTFHERLRDGEAADVALAAAMLHVRKTPKWSDPHYWAAFRVVGTGARARAKQPRR